MSRTSPHSPIVAPLPPAGPGILLRALCKRTREAGAAAFALPQAIHAMAPVDSAALARYNALLGFAPGSMPLGFLYLPTQRAHLATLLGPGFPFRVVGMVHVENTLLEHRRHDPARSLLLTTRAQVEAPTASNARFVRLETTGSDEGEPVFTCTSLYLAQAGARGGQRRTEPPLPAGPPVESWRVAFDTGRAYARVSGDYNPIHLWRWSACLLGMHAPIIHGMHSVGRAAAALERAEGARVTSISARFRAPVPLGADVELLRGLEPGSFVLASGGRRAVEGSYRSVPAS